MSASLPPNAESAQQTTSVVAKVQQNKRLFIIVVAVIVVVFLWNPLIHPLLDLIRYSDQGEFAGRPVYYSEGSRISRTLHREFEACGYNDNDIQDFLNPLKMPSGLTQQYDANGKLFAYIDKEEITTGVYELKINCFRK